MELIKRVRLTLYAGLSSSGRSPSAYKAIAAIGLLVRPRPALTLTTPFSLRKPLTDGRVFIQSQGLQPYTNY